MSFRREFSPAGRWSIGLRLVSAFAGSVIVASSASAQAIEEVGARAQGMGGAFVAVANDSTATWWNPAGMAAGPFVDVTAGAARPTGGNAWGMAVATPVLGASFYRVRTPVTQSPAPTAGPGGDRQEGRVELPDSSLRVGQFGATLAHSVFARLHVGTTVKVVQGLPDADVAGESGQTHADVDVGGLAVAGPLRVGVVARNLVSPVVIRAAGGDVRLDRQIRVGAAFDGNLRPVDRTIPLIVSIDADVVSSDTIRGRRRVVAAGVERWFGGRRIGARAGVRVNQVGEQERIVSVGASYRLITGVMAEGFVAAGSRPERGWGVSVRASF